MWFRSLRKREPVHPPVGTIFEIKNEPRQNLRLSIKADDSERILLSTYVRSGLSDEVLTDYFGSLVEMYKNDRINANREGEYDQWPPQ